MLQLKQSATDKSIPFLLVSSTDHINGVTGLSPTVVISKNCGVPAAPAGTITEIGFGLYALNPTSADTNTLGSLILHASAAGTDPCDMFNQVLATDPYDATTGGIANLDAAVTSRSVPGDAMTLDLTQSVPLFNAAETVGDALNAARAQGFGQWVLTGTNLTLFAPDGATPVRSFTLDDPSNPTQRI